MEKGLNQNLVNDEYIIEDISKSKSASILKELKRNKVLLLMLLPAFLYFLIFSYIPMGGTILAFKNYNFRDGIFGSPFVGFDNFKYFFLSGQAFAVTRNTILYNLGFIVVNTTLQMGMAILISEFLKNILRKLLKQQCFYLISFLGL